MKLLLFRPIQALRKLIVHSTFEGLRARPAAETSYDEGGEVIIRRLTDTKWVVWGPRFLGECSTEAEAITVARREANRRQVGIWLLDDVNERVRRIPR